jgi:hypothetical protein
MGLLDGTLRERQLRLEKMLSPSQYPKPSKKAIDDLKRSIRFEAKKKKPNKSKLKSSNYA